MSSQDELVTKAERLLDRLEALLSKVEEWFPNPGGKDTRLEGNGRIYRWVNRRSGGFLKPIPFHKGIELNDLVGIERQKEALVRNTRQFLKGYEANNVLLWGARGTGKSSLIRALIPAFHDEGLHLVEVAKEDLRDLPDILESISSSPSRFILFCDDLSFETHEPGFKDLKALLDGALSTASDRFLIYATSNRRHFMPEEVATTRGNGGEIHPEETVDERISLSERFGLWLPFYPFDQEVYLEIVFHWLHVFGLETFDREKAREAALQWALRRGSRSGRSAYQFARDFAGRWKMGHEQKEG